MKKSPRQHICNTFFVIKASVALLLGVFFLGLMGINVSLLHDKGLKQLGEETKPTLINPDDPLCNAPLIGARLEPPAGKVMLGFHLDWSKMTPVQMRETVGFTPAADNAFLKMDHTQDPAVDYKMFEWHAQQVKLTGGMLTITIEPLDLGLITAKMIDDLAKHCYLINSKYGVPLFLRFGHEMNGDWNTIGYQPTAFVRVFREVGTAVRSYTNMTVWGPNLGINYPFKSPDAVVTLPVIGSPDFALLDTNKDNVIDALDDPYRPYYPGDDLVDWVALSLYWYPDQSTGFNVIPPPTYFRDMAFATGPSMQIVNPARANDPTRNFYQQYSALLNKPMMIPETAAPWFPQRPAVAQEAEVKRAWYTQLFSAETLAEMPNLKYVASFEEAKQDAGNEFRDWRVTADGPTLKAFQSVFAGQPNVVYGNQFTVPCSGAFVLN